MASRLLEALWSVGKNRTMLHGRYSPAGTGALTNVLGAGFTVARTGVGTHTITFQDRWPILLYTDVQLILGTPTNQYPKIVSYTPATAASAPGVKSTMVINTWDPTANAGAGGAFDVAAGAQNFVMFQVVFSNTTVTFGG